MKKFESDCYCNKCLECTYKHLCVAIINKKVEIKTPITIETRTDVECGRIECGEPKICGYSKAGCSKDKNTCEFIVKQILNIEIPITYFVKALADESYANCNTKKDCSANDKLC